MGRKSGYYVRAILVDRERLNPSSRVENWKCIYSAQLAAKAKEAVARDERPARKLRKLIAPSHIILQLKFSCCPCLVPYPSPNSQTLPALVSSAAHYCFLRPFSG